MTETVVNALKEANLEPKSIFQIRNKDNVLLNSHAVIWLQYQTVRNIKEIKYYIVEAIIK